MLSLPRDLRVNVSGVGGTKLNAAYSYGGVYLPIDQRYYVVGSADYKSIDLQPGYQLVRSGSALDYVRFRHDLKGDFTRMRRLAPCRQARQGSR